MMIWQEILIIWTGLALIWWLLAIGLVARTPRTSSARDEQLDERFVTVFKSLPGSLSKAEFAHFSCCIETFVADLDQNSELLIGCHAQDKPQWQQFVNAMRSRYSNPQIKLVADPEPTRLAGNPKMSWMQILVPHARGELWYWSDADIQAPAGTLRSLRADFAKGNAGMVTSPYSIDTVPNAPSLLDALFVNLEFYPGVTLLKRLNTVCFGLGSGMLFEAGAFKQRVDWSFLGGCLADDYQLGRLLSPVRVGSTRLTTSPAGKTWRDALVHYLRWQKTIRWNRPDGFAAQVLVLPLLGWLIALISLPTSVFVWSGLAVTLGMDVLAALVICHLLHCRIGVFRIPMIPLWSVIRSLTWLACWLPWPVVWRGCKWRSAYQPKPVPRQLQSAVEYSDVN